MPAPTDLNDRIAKAKGWTLYVATGKWMGPSRIWADPDGFPGMHPDFTGTLKGVSGMLRELNEHAKVHDQYWVWGHNTRLIIDASRDTYYCAKFNIGTRYRIVTRFWSPEDHPGDCVGEAYMSMKETTDG